MLYVSSAAVEKPCFYMARSGAWMCRQNLKLVGPENTNKLWQQGPSDSKMRAREKM